jgi:hypothetical protein
METKERLCKLCKTNFTGKQSKIFCSDSCKSKYHFRLNTVTQEATINIDTILHRNRSILLELLGKNGVQKKIERSHLDKKKFHWHFITGYHLNSQNKMVHYVYDFSWMIFSDQEVLLKRLNKKL